jgi:hypothetical protein
MIFFMEHLPLTPLLPVKDGVNETGSLGGSVDLQELSRSKSIFAVIV